MSGSAREQVRTWMAECGASPRDLLPVGYEAAVDVFAKVAALAYAAGQTAEREACAKVCERIRDDRFNEHGVREADTGACYYSGRIAEEFEARDEEDEACAAAIRARTTP